MGKPKKTTENSEEIDAEEAGPSSENKENKIPEKPKLVRLPLARVKNIMKTDPDVNIISHDAVFLATKATELFIEMLSKACFDSAVQTKRKTVMKQDFDRVVNSGSNLCFLDGMME